MAVTGTGAGLEGIIAAESSICYIDGQEGILSYQGFNIHTLAENAKFEEVVFLLWNGRLPKQAELDELKASLVRHRAIPEQVTAFLRSVPQAVPMDVVRTAVSMLGLTIPSRRTCPPRRTPEGDEADGADGDHRYHLRPCSERQGDYRGRPELGLAANFLYTLTGKRPDEVSERAFDIALTLHADHELNASTFAGRVTAATLSDIYSAVTSAIGALKGPLHGGANEDVIRFLLQVDAKSDAAVQEVRNKLTNKMKVAGFGHRVYRTEDPRATHLRKLVRRTRNPHGPRRPVPRFEGSRAVHQEHQGPQRERRLLFRFDVLLPGDSDRSVHADLRGQPHVRAGRLTFWSSIATTG